MSLLTKKLGLKIAIFSAGLGLASALFSPAYASNQTSPLGTNTNELTEDDSSAPFIDLFRAALPFEDARPWLTGANVQLDANGWPARLNGQIAGSRVLSNLPAQTIPAGNYTVLYDGAGKMQYGGDAKIISSQPGRDIIQLSAGADNKYDMSLRIRESDPRNYIRNIRILPPGGICANNPYRRVGGPQACPGNYQAFVT
ncbi:MAG: Unknown protein, partial [uncultured Thiotrichaceae bacterium]